MKKAFVVLFAMAMSLVSMAQTSESQTSPRQGLLAGREKYGWVEAKLGRAFLQAGEVKGEDAQVFYGGAGVGFGLVLKNTMLGIGGAFECVDLTDKSFLFPLYVELRQHFGRSASRGFLVGIKGGWVLGNERSFPAEELIDDQPQIVTKVRSMKGPYVEAMLGYRYNQFDFFVAYNYRTVNYKEIFDDNPVVVPYDEWKQRLHVVMGGVSFRFF